MTAAADDAILYDRRTDRLVGARAVERAGIALLRAITRVVPFPRVPGLTPLTRLIAKLFPSRRDVVVRLGENDRFSFPYGDPYWSVLLMPHMDYEEEIAAFLKLARGIDYTFLDCGANYGYWSVQVTSQAYGAHPAVAIELSTPSAERARRNAALNGDRFEVLRKAVAARSGEAVTVFGGERHEQRSIHAEAAGGVALEAATTVALADLPVAPTGAVVLKLDVEGAECAALEGAGALMDRDLIVLYEDHGNDPHHTVSRAFRETFGLRLFTWVSGTTFREIGDLAELSVIKTVRRVGYDFFATRSPFWIERLTGAGATA